MPMDVYGAGDGSDHIEADLPGMDPDSVDVTLEHSTLTIRAERKPHYGDTDHVLAAERPQGPFTRQLTLGEGLDAGHLSAAYADGVLHVTIRIAEGPAPPDQGHPRSQRTVGRPEHPPRSAATTPQARPAAR